MRRQQRFDIDVYRASMCANTFEMYSHIRHRAIQNLIELTTDRRWRATVTIMAEPLECIQTLGNGILNVDFDFTIPVHKVRNKPLW